MRERKRLFGKVYRLCVRRNYSHAIRLLEPKLSLYLHDTHFLTLLSRLYLLTGDVENAEIYARRGLRSSPDNVDLLLLQAVLHVKYRELAKGLQVWLQVLEVKRHNRWARLGLKLLRRHSDSADLAQFVNSPKFWTLLPPLPGLLAWQRRRALIGLLWLSLSGGLVLFGWYQGWFDKLRPPPKRNAELFQRAPTSEGTGGGVSSLALEEGVRRIEQYYQAYRDNAVRYELNLLRQQALPRKYRDWLNILEALLKPPQIHTLRDNFSFDEVALEPPLYRGCYVLWKGRVANVVKLADAIGFDLLVDYLDGQTLSGQVTVWVDTAATLVANQAVEVFARVVPHADGFYLEGLTLREFEPPSVGLSLH